MRFIRSAFVVCMLLPALAGAACRRDAKQASTTTADSIGAASSGAETFFRYGLADIGTTRDQLKKQYGKPDSIVAHAVKNRHDASQTDSLVTLYYPGLAVELYRVSANGREFASSVHVSDNTYIKPDAPIRIGMSESDVTSVMGVAASNANGVMTYSCDTCTALGNEKVDVLIANGVVAAVTIHYSFD